MADVADWKEVGALIDEITNIANIQSVDLVDRITLIDLITTISTITTVQTITAISNILNINSLDLIDRITLIDEITKIGVAYTTDYIDPAQIFLDTFEATPISWLIVGVGTAARDTTHVYRGEGSLKFTTGAVASSIYMIARDVGLRLAGTLALSFRFTIPASGLEYFEPSFEWDNNPSAYIPGVRWDRANAKWQYLDNANAWQDISGGAQGLSGGDDLWHYLKLTVDFSAGEYVSLVCDDKTMSLAGIGYYTGATTAYRIRSIFRASPSAAAAVDLYFDDIKLEVVS